MRRGSGVLLLFLLPELQLDQGSLPDPKPTELGRPLVVVFKGFPPGSAGLGRVPFSLSPSSLPWPRTSTHPPFPVSGIPVYFLNSQSLPYGALEEALAETGQLGLMVPWPWHLLPAGQWGALQSTAWSRPKLLGAGAHRAGSPGTGPTPAGPSFSRCL